MQSFTQTEIKWMIGALQEKARAYHEEEQFDAMACKLQKVLDGKSRRVEITL